MLKLHNTSHIQSAFLRILLLLALATLLPVRGMMPALATSLISPETHSLIRTSPTRVDAAVASRQPIELETQLAGTNRAIRPDNPNLLAGSPYSTDAIFAPSHTRSTGTLAVCSDSSCSFHESETYNAGVYEEVAATFSFTMTSITKPVQLRLNPVKAELFVRGETSTPPPLPPTDPQGRRLIRLDIATQQETAMVQLPYNIVDYGITQDGQWIYALTDYVLYTINTSTFQVVDQFIPTNIEPSNALLFRLGVFSSTLVYVGTNPGFASGGPIYQWNPLTDEWLPTAFCNSRASRAELKVSADYTTIGGLCEPRASPATSFLYRLGDTAAETWTSDIRLDAAISSDGRWLLTSLYPHECVNLLSNHYGETLQRYISTSVCGWAVGSLTFGSGYLGYASPGGTAVTEVAVAGGFEARYLTFSPLRIQGTSYVSAGGLAKSGNWLYVALQPALDPPIGEIIAIYVDPFDSAPPSSQVNSLPAFSDNVFPVSWSGTDIGAAGLYSYDVQYRDGAAGVWTDWFLDTVEQTADFTGEYGHTYYFRCRARDNVGNLEEYPGADGDTSTCTCRYSLTGRVLGNRRQPIFAATVQSHPSALNIPSSDHVGNFTLCFDQSSLYDLTVARHGFGTLPVVKSVSLTDTLTPLELYLPPSDDRVVDGGFETGSLAAWMISGEIEPVLTTTTHSGNYGVALGGPISPTTFNLGLESWNSGIEQVIVLSPTLISPTLSLLYQVPQAEPISDTLQVFIVGTDQTVTHTLPLNISGWTQHWFDLSVWENATITLQIQWSQSEKNRTTGVILDEISLGSALTGVYSVHLPLIVRNGP